ncbi:hypothetical protein [Mailhella sp.]|uniref:hypothetical protein n=1 Tax=Mailhella sp. TaxID=1981029 RepID=UPI0040630ACB
MAFTEQELRNQQQEIARLADELNRLNSELASQKKALGYGEDEEISISEAEMTPELEQVMAEAVDAARRQGKALASQLQPASACASSSAGRGRRDAMRI